MNKRWPVSSKEMFSISDWNLAEVLGHLLWKLTLGRVCVSLLHCVQCCREACVCLHQKKRSLKWKEIGCFWVWEEDDSKSWIWLFVSQVKSCFVEKDSLVPLSWKLLRSWQPQPVMKAMSHLKQTPCECLALRCRNSRFLGLWQARLLILQALMS